MFGRRGRNAGHGLCKFRVLLLCGNGLSYRLGWGIGVQRVRFDSSLCFGGLWVGRGFGRGSIKLHRRVEGGCFEFGVQGYALGFGIEDVWHDSSSDSFARRRCTVDGWHVLTAVARQCRWPRPRQPRAISVEFLERRGFSQRAGGKATRLLGKHQAGNGWLEGGRS